MFLLPTKEFLDVVESVLLAAGKPVEVGDLVRVLADLGAIDADADFNKQKHDVYSKVWMEPKKHGDASRWQRTGKGMWCHVKHLTAEMIAGDAGAIRTLGEVRQRAKMEGRTRRPTREERHVEDADRRCGNCASLRFFGVHYLSLKSGGCERWPETGAHGPYVRTSMPACELWRRRTEAQRDQDRHQHGLDLIAIAEVNAGVRVNKRGMKRVAPSGTQVITTSQRAEEEDEDA